MNQELSKEKRKNEIRYCMICLVLSFFTTYCMLSALHRGFIGWFIIMLTATILNISFGVGGVLK